MILEAIKQCRDSFIVIDNADCMINDDVRRFINFELSNQYMLFYEIVTDSMYLIRALRC